MFNKRLNWEWTQVNVVSTLKKIKHLFHFVSITEMSDITIGI